MGKVIGIDIGATNLRVSLGNDKGKLIKIYSEKTDSKNLLQQIQGLVSNFPDFEGIGVASVGPLDSKRGVILNPPNLNVRNVKIVEFLKNKFAVPTYLLNDCVAAVLGEKVFGAGKGVENLVYITISTGIGCGVIVDNNLILGKDGNAHEVGHCVIDAYGGTKSGYGACGQWEAYCSGRNIQNFVRFLLKTKYRNVKSTLVKHEKTLTSKLFFKLAETDNVAKKILDEIGRLNAIGVANVINCYDPELITVGGSVVLNNVDAIMKPIEKYVKDYTINRMPKIIITPLGKNIVLYGAIASMINNW